MTLTPKYVVYFHHGPSDAPWYWLTWAVEDSNVAAVWELHRCREAGHRAKLVREMVE